MIRALQLATWGEASVAPNPMVGAVLVHDRRIIGEGFHQLYGGPHAEVNCLNSVLAYDQHLISDSTLYVSLEPCAHFGKTPPCANLIVEKGIRHVVVAAGDPFAHVNGKGLQVLRNAGVRVEVGVLENEALYLNKYFFTFHQKRRPYVVLKWAESADGFIAADSYQAIKISNELSNRFVHRLRGTTQAIMVGTNTAIHDNPALTSRLWIGKNPLRIVIDKELRIPGSSALFKTDARVFIFNCIKDHEEGHIRYIKVSTGDDMLVSILSFLYHENVQSLLVEGGAKLLRSFIKAGLWDETIIIKNNKLHIGSGVATVERPDGILQKAFSLNGDDIRILKNPVA